MILHEVPTATDVLADLDDVLSMIWQALEVGVGSAIDFFVSHGLTEPDDRGLAAHLTRYQAKHVLDGLQQDSTFEREDLPFSGLLLRTVRNDRHYVIRIRRSIDGLLPPPQTGQMELFYWQPYQPYLPYDGAATEPQPAVVNLMVLWTTNSDYALTSVRLALPMLAEPDEDVETHWEVSIPHPAITIGTTPTAGNTDGGSGSVPAQAQTDDLDIGDVADDDEQTGE